MIATRSAAPDRLIRLDRVFGDSLQLRRSGRIVACLSPLRAGWRAYVITPRRSEAAEGFASMRAAARFALKHTRTM